MVAGVQTRSLDSRGLLAALLRTRSTRSATDPATIAVTLKCFDGCEEAANGCGTEQHALSQGEPALLNPGHCFQRDPHPLSFPKRFLLISTQHGCQRQQESVRITLDDFAANACYSRTDLGGHGERAGIREVGRYPA